MNINQESVPPTPSIRVESEFKNKFFSAACHLGGIASSIPLIGVGIPFIIWQVFKGESPFTDTHGTNAFNFQMTLLLLRIPSYVLMIIGIGFLMIAIIELVSVVCAIIAAWRAIRGLEYTYPFRYPFIK